MARAEDPSRAAQPAEAPSTPGLPGCSDPAAACPCGLGLPHGQCCGRWLAAHAADGALGAPSAEALMRSRYTAYALLGQTDPATDDGARAVRALVAYLRATWAPETRPDEAELLPAPDRPAVRFTRLVVTDTAAGGPFDATGTVDFIALGRHPGADSPRAAGPHAAGSAERGAATDLAPARGERFRLHERSRFRREAGVWLYVDGAVDGGWARSLSPDR